jgi:anti-repressor protein
MELSIVAKQEVLGKQINVYGDIENPLFLAKDVASWLEHSDVHKMVESVDDDEKVRNIVPTLGGNQEAWMLTENGLYEVFMLSRKPIAKQLKKGIKEMLHSVRLHGAYMTPDAIEKTLSDPDYLIRLATTLKEEKQKRLEAEQRNSLLESINKEQAPKAAFTDAVVASSSSCLIGELAKILTQNGYGIGQNRLFALLRGKGYLGTRGDYYNMPNQQYVEQGLFEIKKSVHSENGVMKTTSTPKVTGKGQVYFVNKFLAKKARPSC